MPRIWMGIGSPIFFLVTKETTLSICHTIWKTATHTFFQKSLRYLQYTSHRIATTGSLQSEAVQTVISVNQSGMYTINGNLQVSANTHKSWLDGGNASPLRGDDIRSA